jgi:hypothetical protein
LEFSGYAGTSGYTLKAPEDTKAHAGTYEVSCWAKVSSDYNGIEQVLRAVLVTEAGNKQVGVGGFPKNRDAWEKITMTLSTHEVVSDWRIQVGYPLQFTEGSVMITGLSVLYNYPVAASFVSRPVTLHDWVHVLVSNEIEEESGDNVLRMFLNGEQAINPMSMSESIVFNSTVSLDEDVTGQVSGLSSIAGKWDL